MMAIEFKTETRNSTENRGIARDGNKEVEFVIRNSILEVTNEYGDDFIVELIETILSGYYTYLKYEGELYTRLSDVSSIMQMSKRGDLVTV